MTRIARVAAQAKVNLFLRIGPADESGYHALATQFQRIDLADVVVVEVGGSERSLDCDGPFLPAAGLGPAERNLAFRAAQAYAERAQWGGVRGFRIHLTKHIPAGGGLGGGSADAGAVLRCLDALAAEPLGPDALAAIARTLGADVPFLTSEHVSAVGVGRGDRILGIPPLAERPIVLAVPDFPIATADAYRALDNAGGGSLPRSSVFLPQGDEAEWRAVPGVGTLRDWSDAARASHNDFEAVLEPRFPRLRALRESLASAGAMLARLSGSGSTVFAVFEGDPPPSRDLSLDALVISARTSARVVQVEVLE